MRDTWQATGEWATVELRWAILGYFYRINVTVAMLQGVGFSPFSCIGWGVGRPMAGDRSKMATLYRKSARNCAILIAVVGLTAMMKPIPTYPR